MRHIIIALGLALLANVATAETRCVSRIPVITTGAYAAGDNIGGLNSLTTALKAGGGVMTHLILADEGAEGKQVDVCLYSSRPSASTFTNDSAQAIADADLPKIIDCVLVSSFKSFSDNGIGRAPGLSLAVQSDSNDLFFSLVAREAVTYDAVDALILTVCIVNDKN